MGTIIKANKGKIEPKTDVEEKPFYIGQLERELLALYPREDAIEGDRMGLLVGDPNARITRVAVALDPTVTAISAAKAAGANLLLTHHPTFRGGVEGFCPVEVNGQTPGAVVYEAIKNDVALMNFHTALDASEDAHRVLPSLLHLTPLKGKRVVNGQECKARILEPLPNSRRKGFGQVCSSDQPITLKELASRCTSVFARAPRVWGDLDKKCATICTCTGSTGGLIPLAIKNNIDVLVCGEVKYHDALYAKESGLCIIELGHDTSELPLAAVLANTCKKIGLASSQIVILDQTHNWQQIQSIMI